MSKAYENAGVNINAGYEAVERISSHVERTMRKEVFGGLGGFGATFDLSQLNMTAPLLVSGTDGVGTKLKLAIDNNKYDTIGIDVVAMCVNDILTTGAQPLYFLDYIATNKVVPEVIEQIVKGVSDGCEQTNTALIGGETAEMGDMYHEGDYDLAGFAVGAVEKDAYIDGSQVKTGHVLVGLSSSGIHSNGYSLVRKIIANSGVNLNDNFDEDRTYLQTFLEPTRLYVKPVLDILNQFKVYAMTHITGGGFYENIPRALPEGVTAQIDATAYEVPNIFKWLQQHGDIPADEMYNVFNMGIGFTLVVDKENSDAIIKIAQQHDIDAYVIGEIVEGNEPIQITGGIKLTKIAIFASGSGSNFENIMTQIEQGLLPNIEVKALYTDQLTASCIERARQFKLDVHINELKNFDSKEDYERKILEWLTSEKVEWIVLAGYMKLIGTEILNAYDRRILNIHPSLLPKYKGKDAVGQALNSGDDITGTTVHYVDSGMDTGEIIAQRTCPIYSDDNKESLETRIKQLEHKLYPEVIAEIIQ